MPKNSKVGYAIKANDGLDVPADMKMGRLPTPQQLSSYIKKVTQFSETEYHETDVLEVKEVIRNRPNVRLGVRGLLINGKGDPGLVIPINLNTTSVPVVGEHVVVVEREGVVYYTDIINRKNSLNENSIPGVVGDYDSTTKYGKNFERKKVKPIDIGEGCITFEGRFGQTLHFDGHENTPKIKISTHVDESDGNYRKESIDSDDASIYLTSRGMRDRFDGEQIEGKKVLIQSDGIFIKGRQEVKINAPNLSVINDEVKLGSRDATQAVVLGDELKKILEDIASVLKLLPVAIDNTQSPLSAKDPQMVSKIAGLTLKINNMLSKKVKTI